MSISEVKLHSNNQDGYSEAELLRMQQTTKWTLLGREEITRNRTKFTTEKNIGTIQDAFLAKFAKNLTPALQ